MAADCPNEADCRAGIWIPVVDAARARNFYRIVFNWKCMDAGIPSPIEGIEETYFFTSGSTLSGCFCLMDKSKIVHFANKEDTGSMGVHAVFSVQDLEKSLVLLEANGGQRHVGKTSMGPNMGFIARFIDCEGNLIGLHAMN